MGDAGDFQPIPTTFDRSAFIQDFTRVSDTLNAPYSEETLIATLKDFDEHLDNSSVVIRCTSRVGDILNFRIFLRERVDTIALAASKGHLKSDHPLAKLATSWSAMYEGDSEQWCDFNPLTGLAKTWVNFRRLRPVTEILTLPEFPTAVQAHAPVFQGLGLDKVCFSAVDYHGKTLNVYFVVPGKATDDQAAAFTELVGCHPPTPDELDNMRDVMGPAFAFAVTIDFESGRINRVAFYALEVPKLPRLGERLTKFFEEVPTHDQTQTSIVSWSYGLGDSKYMKAEFGYAGELSDLLAGMVALWKQH